MNAYRTVKLCATLASSARDLAADLDRLANGIELHGDKLPLHEREVAYAMDAMVSGLDIVKSLMRSLEKDMDRALRLREMVRSAQDRCRHYSKSCLHLQRKQHQRRKA